MKNLIAISVVLFIIFTAGIACAKSVSDQVVILIKVERALKLEIGEEGRDKTPQQGSVKELSPETLIYTVTE